MKKKYPVLKCTKELWNEIKPVLESWRLNNRDFKFINIDWAKNPYLVSNFGNMGYVYLANLFNFENGTDSRYLVNTKEEWLTDVAKLLGKEYKPINKNNMERINIAEKLKNCPKGFQLYSKIHGNVKLVAIRNDTIYVTANYYDASFDKFGIYDTDFPDGECLLFPSKERQDWNKFCCIEIGHRVMCSNSGVDWYLKEYYEDNKVFDLSNNGEWLTNIQNYIVPVEDFDFQAENLKDNIKKSIV